MHEVDHAFLGYRYVPDNVHSHIFTHQSVVGESVLYKLSVKKETTS